MACNNSFPHEGSVVLVRWRTQKTNTVDTREIYGTIKPAVKQLRSKATTVFKAGHSESGSELII